MTPYPLAKALLGTFLGGFAMGAGAVDFRVTTSLDEYDGQCTKVHCSLRDAVAAANATSDSRIILGAQSYTLSRANPVDEENEIIDEDLNDRGDLDVKSSVTIIGVATDQTRIDGGRVDRIFEVLPGASLELRNLRLDSGKTPYYGGALENYGSASLEHVLITGNDASSLYQLGRGGGVANFGELKVHRSTITGNRANGSESSYGQGAGIYNKGTLWVRDSQITNNQGSDDNDMGQGGGLYNLGSADIARTAFIGNRVRVGGTGAAIHNLGYLKLSNSTLSNNYVGEYRDGAALDNGERWEPSLHPRAELIHVTIAGNTGYGLANLGEVSIRNSIIAGNRLDESVQAANCFNGPNAQYSARGLLLATGSGNCTGSVSIDDAVTFTRHLFPLAENNGTQVHTLRMTSAAIDTAVGSCSSHDQRSLNRPRDGNGDGARSVTWAPSSERAREVSPYEKARHGGGLFGKPDQLLDLGFLVDHMLANGRIKFLDLDLVGHGAFVLVGGVEMAGTGTGHQTDQFAHD